jgi:hypothetical protein
MYTAERALKELGEKVPAGVKSSVEEKISTLKSLMTSEDPDTLRKATEDLNSAMQQIGAAAYQQQGPQAGPSDGPGEPPNPPPGDQPGKDDDVVDGEFRNA